MEGNPQTKAENSIQSKDHEDPFYDTWSSDRRLLQELGPKFGFKDGSTLLHKCVNKPPRYVYTLANGGIPVNIQNKDGNTALHLAVKAGNYDVTQALLRCTADTSSKNNMGQTPVDIAEEHIRDLLIRYQPGALHAVMHGKAQTLDRLCKGSWISVATIVKDGMNLMQVALSRVDKDPNMHNCCRVLQEYRDTSELVHAVLSEDEDKLRGILSESKGYTVNVRCRDRLGSTLLSHAISTNCLDIARLLVDAGSRVNKIRLREHETSSTTMPLFHIAVQKNIHLEMAKFLFDVQDVTERAEKDSHGHTAILRAIDEGLPVEYIQWLIKVQSGKCLTHRTEHGLLPVELAIVKGRSDVADAIDKYIAEQDKRLHLVCLPVHFYGHENLRQIHLNNQTESTPRRDDHANHVTSVEERGIALFEAAARGDLSQVMRLNDAEYQDKNGFTALTRAIVFNQPEVAKYLCVARPELKSLGDNCNRYPLHYACALPDDQMGVFVRILLERNPEEIETRVDKDGRYPVEYKKLRDTEEIRRMLHDARNLDAYGNRGSSAVDLQTGSYPTSPQEE